MVVRMKIFWKQRRVYVVEKQSHPHMTQILHTRLKMDAIPEVVFKGCLHMKSTCSCPCSCPCTPLLHVSGNRRVIYVVGMGTPLVQQFH